MIEALAAVSRLLATAAAAALLGSIAFRYVCLRAALPRAWVSTDRLVSLAVSLVLLGHGGMLIAQLLALPQIDGPAVPLVELVSATHVGRIWMWRAGTLAVLVALAAASRHLSAVRARGLHLVMAGLSAAYLGLGVWGGHAAAAESPWRVLPANLVHVLAMALWFGALPAWLISVRAFLLVQADAPNAAALAHALQRFSKFAMALMGVVIVSGYWLADGYMETAGDLLGTRYGLLIVCKLLLLAMVLFLANQLRTRFLPTLKAVPRAPTDAALRHAFAEWLAGFGILACAAWLAQTTPALHEAAPAWWLPFRWSIDATWEEDPALRVWIVLSLLAVLAGLVVCRLLHETLPRIAALATTLIAAAVLAWALAVPAYPDTYLRSQVPYLTLSVAQGRALYAEHCTSCHGPGGLGDGVHAAKLPKPPANLSEPHTALHTVGDMHWWLAHGIPESGMPGFGAVMSEENRWDLINFMRAFSQGFESRILRAAVVADQAWLGAINFYIEAQGASSELKAYRDTQHNVLLAFLGGPEASSRAAVLATALPGLQRRRTAVLVVPLDDAVLPADLPFPVLRVDAAELWSAYELLSRTAGDRGAPDRLGMQWDHAEFLIDRFGYVRARWIAQDDSAGWQDPARLYPELERLNAEPRLRPPPDDHIH